MAITPLLSVVCYNLVWFSTVYGWSLGLPWVAFLAFGLHAGLILILEKHGRENFHIIWQSVAIGFFVESLNQIFGVMPYLDQGFLAPSWILPLWGSFGLFFKYGLTFLHDRKLLAAILGAFGGAFTYLGAASIAQVSFGFYQWLYIFIEWGLLTPLYCWLIRRKK